MSIDPRIPTMPGRGMPGFHRPGRNFTCTKREREAPKGVGGDGTVLILAGKTRR